MKQKIYDIPIWETYEEHITECALCDIEKNLEKSFMDILFDDMLMTPFFAKQLQEFSFCSHHYEGLYRYKDKLGLAIIVNNFLQCEKESLEKYKKQDNLTKKSGILKGLIKSREVKQCDNIQIPKDCYLCKKIDENMPDYIEVLIMLWRKEQLFRELYSKSKGHCKKHFNMLFSFSGNYLSGDNEKTFKEITLAMQVENTDRLINELDWFISKYDYRFQNEPWKNSKDALPRCIKKLEGDFNDES